MNIIHFKNNLVKKSKLFFFIYDKYFKIFEKIFKKFIIILVFIILIKILDFNYPPFKINIFLS